jgi:chaperonin GroES
VLAELYKLLLIKEKCYEAKTLARSDFGQESGSRNRSEGGIIILTLQRKAARKGLWWRLVTGDRDNGTRLDMTVKEGDRILFGKYSGSEVKLEGEEYHHAERGCLGVTEGASKTKSTTK